MLDLIWNGVLSVVSDGIVLDGMHVYHWVICQIR